MRPVVEATTFSGIVATESPVGVTEGGSARGERVVARCDARGDARGEERAGERGIWFVRFRGVPLPGIIAGSFDFGESMP